ncbi:hypothetical protein FNF29_02790 [Cafeteria roenbergensis]|uniref:Uncharacterized protein n=1 Tax=Cafeteria roenbergensis TaxID=33653 RepID=A0A5A8CPV5_CAFRO|nr:hypothetical protein FNF29_02790 [Cafeteria roenbergensis]|eukprot:KAA0153801.1 hypothetical protein FNF29_02790 [Cafeteria roenbergensis]
MSARTGVTGVVCAAALAALLLGEPAAATAAATAGQRSWPGLVEELCGGRFLASGAAGAVSGAPGSLADLARLCGQPALEPIGVCPGDFRVPLTDFGARFPAGEWPELTDPFGANASHAGTTHASGWRGAAALPCANGLLAARLEQDSRGWSGNSSGRCERHAFDMGRIERSMLPGERILIVESWVVPTAVTPPCCDDPTQWWLAFSGVDGLYERRCWDHFPYVSPSLANSVMLTSDYASAAAGFLAYTSLQTTHNASSNRASTVAQAWPVIGEVSEPAINGEPIGARPFLRRPHQLITVMIVNASGTGLLSLPDSQPAAAAAARGQQTASASLIAPGWDPSTMAWAAREGSLVAGIWDGSSSGASCRITGDTAQGSPRPPWQAYSPPANLYPTSALACFGGHNTTCDASASACLSAAAVGYHNVSDPTVRRCARDWVLGSMTYSMPSAPTQPWWQIGTTALTAWWKPG